MGTIKRLLFLSAAGFFSNVCFGELPDCSKAKTPDECAICCGQLIGANGSGNSLAEGCLRLAESKSSFAKSEAVAKLEYQTGISSSSVEAICSSSPRDYVEAREKQPATYEAQEFGVVRSCIKTCKKPKKAKQ
jgi:hypothetical protein